MVPRPPRALVDSATFSLFVENLREGLCLAKPGGEILDANPAFLELFGVRRREDLPASDAARLLELCEERELSTIFQATSAVSGFEFEIQRADGEPRTVLVTVVREGGEGQSLFHLIVFDVSERKRLENELQRQALRDPLTGCYNRRFLAQRALELEGTATSWGAIVVDVDGFTSFNLEHGDVRGDRELTRLSRFLLRATRAHESVVRIGDDEFLLLLSDADERATEIVADRLRLAAAREEVLPFSLGYAFRIDDESVLSTLDRAEARLQTVKLTPSGARRKIRETALAAR